MDKQILENLVNENRSTREMVEIIGKSQATIKYWLKKYDLKSKIPLYNRGGLSRKTKARRTESTTCPTCGESNLDQFYKRPHRNWGYQLRCKKCHNDASMDRYKKHKKLAVDYKGGKCQKCGYNACQAALDFHHENPAQKDPNWRQLRAKSFEKMRPELDKCVLLCKNCHSELHCGVDSPASP